VEFLDIHIIFIAGFLSTNYVKLTPLTSKCATFFMSLVRSRRANFFYLNDYYLRLYDQVPMVLFAYLIVLENQPKID
jgi:hypothetical protein